jgi:hypothetical protein
VHEILDIAWLTALREETEKARRASCTMLYLSGVLGLAMVEWQL